MVVVDMNMVCRPNMREKLGDFCKCVGMPEIKREADSLDPPSHPHELPRVPAEELFLADHVFKAGKHSVLNRTLPDPAQSLFLEVPDFLRHKFACTVKDTRDE